MNRDDILKMEAGNDLDALIAKYVFGMEIGKTFKGVWVVNPKYEDVYGNPSNTATGWRAERYSTAISLAWKVVGAMENKGFVWSMDFDAHSYTFAFDFMQTAKDRFEANGMSSAPLAICRAALLAVLEDA